MIHPHTKLAFINNVIGSGVVATRRIPKGTITWVDDPFDMVISPAQYDKLSPLYHHMIDRYGYDEPDGSTVLCWDHARFVNHDCEPSCMAGPYDFEVAVRDIEVGEQLTDDYASMCLDRAFPCACGRPNCRRVIRPGDERDLKALWERRVAEALVGASSLEQPLFELLDSRSQELFIAPVRAHVPRETSR